MYEIQTPQGDPMYERVSERPIQTENTKQDAPTNCTTQGAFLWKEG